jgi:hypothetical protein
MPSEAMPAATVKRLNCSSTSSPTSDSPTMNSAAARALTCPDGSGRPRVRATCASSLRSTMSLKVEPAARITTAPTRKSRQCQGFG